MPEITTSTVPCCATDFSTGRILWEWHEGHWIIAAKPAPAQKQHEADRQG